MRGRLAILLLALYTCSIIHLDELLKLPKLLAHFQTHHCTDPSMSFTDFLGLHYTMGQFQQNDYEEDILCSKCQTGIHQRTCSDIIRYIYSYG